MLSFPVTKLESTIRDYIVHLRHDRKLSPGTVSSYLAPIIHFYEMNGVVIAHASTRVQCIPDYSTISRRINKIVQSIQIHLLISENNKFIIGWFFSKLF